MRAAMMAAIAWARGAASVSAPSGAGAMERSRMPLRWWFRRGREAARVARRVARQHHGELAVERQEPFEHAGPGAEIAEGRAQPGAIRDAGLALAVIAAARQLQDAR
jgi:hypothetical protein